jgi:tripartite-type tricarboxylate transporter receptor subunit TctC
MKKITLFIAGFLAMFYLTFLVHMVQAQTYPSRSIQLVIAMAPGDIQDIMGRAISFELSKVLKTPVIPLNKPGGSGTVAGDVVAKGKKDGYSILCGNPNVYNVHAMDPEGVPYNPFQDLEPLCSVASVPFTVAVNADSPWKSFHDLVDYIQKNPGKVRGSSAGVGSTAHFCYEIIRSETRATITMVPFKGGSPAIMALLGGHVEVTAVPTGLLSPHIKAGKIRALLNSHKVSEFPDVPTLVQLGYKRDLHSNRVIMFVPTGVPDSVKNVLASALEESIKSANVVKAIHDLGLIEDYKPAEEFKKMMIEEYEMVKGFFKAAGRAGN